MNLDQTIAPDAPPHAVIRVLPIQFRSRLLGFSRKAEFPAVSRDAVLFVEVARDSAACGSAVVHWKVDDTLVNGGLPEQALRFITVRQGNFPTTLTFPAVVRSSGDDCHDWDLSLGVTLNVDHAETLLRCGAAAPATPRLPVDAAAFAAWIAPRLQNAIRDAIGEPSAVELQSDALPAQWWQLRLNEWLAPLGLRSVSVDTPSWTSAAFDRAQAEAKARQLQAEQQQHEQAEREARLEHLRQLAAYDLAVGQINADTALDRQQREARLREALLEAQQRIEACEARAEEERRQLERLASLRQAEYQAELDRIAAAASHAEALRIVEVDQALAKADAELEERRRTIALRLQQLEADARLSDAQRRAAVEQLERERREAAATHEAQMADIARRRQLDEERVRTEAAELAQRRLAAEAAALEIQRAQAEAERKAQELEDDRRVIADRSPAAAAAVMRLMGATDPHARRQIVSELIEEHAYSPSMLDRLGIDVSAEILLDRASRQSHAYGSVSVKLLATGPSKVSLTPVGQSAGGGALISRAIGALPRITLRPHESLALGVRSENPGYATLLNFGSSGDVILHTPSVWVAPYDARVTPGQRMTVPGDPLLPAKYLDNENLEYAHDGTPGWEYLVLLVTPTPLIEPQMLRETPRDFPLLQLYASDLRAINDRLSRFADDAWRCGVLKLRVA